MTASFKNWLKEHLDAAKIHYDEVCKLDDKELETGDSSAYYEQAHQMFGYIAALEKCLKQANPAKPSKRVAKIRR